MKKLLGTLVVTVLAVSVFAQGTLVFNNATGYVQKWTSTTDSTLTRVPAGGAYVELIAAPTGTALANPLFTAAANGVSANYSSLSAFITANPGWQVVAGTGSAATASPIAVIAGLAGNFSGGNVTVGNIADGASAEYLVIGWTGTATGLDTALAGTGLFGGESAIFTTTTGDPLNPLVPSVNTKATFTGMTLAPIVIVPEPATFALAGLGLAALLAFRRRNS